MTARSRCIGVVDLEPYVPFVRASVVYYVECFATAARDRQNHCVVR